MSSASREKRPDDSESVQRLADKVVQDVRQGKRPSSAQLEEQFPEFTGDIGGLVKTLSVLEEASHRRRRANPDGVVINAAGRRQQMLGGFRLIREISRGGMGIVYEAEQESLSRRVALKVLPPSPLLTDTERSRFQREGTAIARLHHSHIVPVFGMGEQDGVQYCVMQYIEGYSLNRLLVALRQRCGRVSSCDDGSDSSSGAASTSDVTREAELPDFPLRSAVDSLVESDVQDSEANLSPTYNLSPQYWRNIARLGADVADALQHAHHQGVLHRDIKPGNLILDQDGHVWVADFGLAKVHDSQSLTTRGNLVGTLRYSPPEQFQGQSDARSDIYSLGLTLYELCTLETAFSSSDRHELVRQVVTETPASPRSVNAKIPRDLETIILKAIAPEPQNRYQTACALSDDLENYLADRPLAARRLSALQRGFRWCRRHRAEATLGGLVLAMLMLVPIIASIAFFREARLRRESDQTAAATLEALDRVYNSYLPDWTTSSTVSAHGSISVTPATAQLLEELVGFYTDVAHRSHNGSEKRIVIESATALRRVGLIYHRLGKFQKARRSYEEAIQRLGVCYRQYPDAEVSLQYATTLNEFGVVFWTEHRFHRALRSHQQALTLLTEIVERNQDDASLQFEFARTLYLMGRRGRGLGGAVLLGHSQALRKIQTKHPNYGKENVDRATAVLEDLLDRFPTVLKYRHLLALCYREYANRLVDVEGQPVDQAMRDALNNLEDLVYAEPENPAYRYSLITTLRWVIFGDKPSRLALDEVAARLQRSAEIAERLSSERPQEWIYQACRVLSLMKLGNTLKRGGDLHAALAKSKQAVVVATGLSEKYADSEFFFWAGLANRRHADLLRLDQQHESSLQAYGRAIDHLNAIHGKDSARQLDILKDLAKAHLGKYRVLETLGRTGEAKSELSNSEDYRQQLSDATVR